MCMNSSVIRESLVFQPPKQKELEGVECRDDASWNSTVPGTVPLWCIDHCTLVLRDHRGTPVHTFMEFVYCLCVCLLKCNYISRANLLHHTCTNYY